MSAYFTYHHVLCHNLFACLGWVVLVALLAKNRRVCVIQCALNWHLHLACDYFGSRGPDSPRRRKDEERIPRNRSVAGVRSRPRTAIC